MSITVNLELKTTPSGRRESLATERHHELAFVRIALTTSSGKKIRRLYVGLATAGTPLGAANAIAIAIAIKK